MPDSRYESDICNSDSCDGELSLKGDEAAHFEGLNKHHFSPPSTPYVGDTAQ